MKRMLRWRFRRCIAAIMMFAMTFPLGEQILGSAFVPAANAASARQQSVVVFDFSNKSNQGGEGLARAFTRQLRLVIDQSPVYDLVTYSTTPPYGASIQRAINEQRLQAQELSSAGDPATAVKIANILGAEYALCGDIDEDGYEYDAKTKQVTIKVTAMLYSTATGEPTNSVTATGVGTGDALQGILEEKARQDASRIIEAKLAGRQIDQSSNSPKAKRKASVLPYVLGGVAAVVLAVSLGGGKSGSGPAAPGLLNVSATRDGVQLQWASSPDPNITAYRISRAAVSGRSVQADLPFVAIADVPANQSTYLDQPPVIANVRYAYRVVPVAGSKEGSAILADRSVAPGEPGVVTGLQASVNQRTIQLSWSVGVSDFITGYRVYRSDRQNGTFTRIADVASSQRTYVDSGLAGGTTFFYKVTALGVNSQESDLAGTTAVSASSDQRPSAPRGVVASTTLGKREIVLSWQASAEPDVQYYQVYRGYRRSRAQAGNMPVNIWSKFPSKLGTRGGPYQILADHLTATSIVDTNVDFNNAYYYVVRAVSSQGESAYSDEVSAAPNNAPATVQTLTAQAGDGSVTLNWTPLAESDIQGYNVYRQVVNQDTKTKITDTPIITLQYIDKQVANDTQYLYFVTALDASGIEGALSVPAGPVTPTAPPAAPANLRASASNGKVTLVWDRNTEANLQEYRVYRSDSPTLTPLPIGTVSKLDSMFTDETSQNLVTYYYEISAVNTSGVESPRSARVFATPDVPPARPDNVQMVASDRSVTVTWSPVTRRADGRDLPISLLKGYRVYRTLATTGVRTLIKELTLADLQGQPKYDDRSAPAGVPLTYSVTAFMLDSSDGVLESEHGVPVDNTPVMVVRRLQAPTGFTGMPGNTTVSLSWQPSADPAALGYVIYVSQSASGPFARLFAPVTTGGQPVLGVNTTQYTVTGLHNDTPYWFRIATVDKLGVEGIQSDPAITVVPNPVPVAPSNVVAVNTDGAGNALDMAVDITWAAPTPAPGQIIAGYRVYRADNPVGPFELITSTPVAASPTPRFRDQFTEGSVTPPEAKDRDFYYQVVTLVQFPNAGLVESLPTTSATAARVLDLAPPALSFLQPTVAGGLVTLKWVAPVDSLGLPLKDLTYYIIQRRLKADPDWSNALQVQVPAGSVIYQDTDSLISGTSYVYRIQARDYSNQGPWSVEREITVP